MKITIAKIVEKYLRDNGYDGLYCGITCDCLLEDGIMHCKASESDNCKTGYKVTCKHCGMTWVYPKKQKDLNRCENCIYPRK